MEDVADKHGAGRYQVGDLVVDTAVARVTRNDLELPMPKLSYDLLIALMEAAPALLTTDQLLDRVWPGLVVNPETVTQRVKLLRTALGDDPRRPRYIHVSRGRGYRMLAAVHRLDPPAASGVATTTMEAPVPAQVGARPLHVRAVVMALLLTVSLAATLAAIAYFSKDPAGDESAPFLATAQPAIAVMPFSSMGDADADRVLSRGIAEAVLHQLSTLGNLTVIARSSSFSLEKESLGARTIGQRLGAKYVLEGSVQRNVSQLRITTQLIDAGSGASLWSLQFDRDIRDVFAMQDEIALKVAQALRLSLDVASTERASGQGTRNFDAYFEYLQARSILADRRIADLPKAFEHLQRSIQLDPAFARAYVELAVGIVRQAEFAVGPDRGQRFEAALLQSQQLIERALQLDPAEGRAYLQRAYVLTFSDLLQAEKDYRHGLALAPNDASGYAGLAALLFQDARRHDESLVALEKARRLDPLDPGLDITKAVFLFYGRGDARESMKILREVVEREPQYAPGLIRLGELSLMTGDIANCIRYHSLGLSMDASAELAIRELLIAYLDVGEEASARALLASLEPEVPARELPLHVFRRQWIEAGELAYLALQSETFTAYDEHEITLALRRHARVTGEIREAIATLEQYGGIVWSDEGEPQLPSSIDMRAAATGVADLLLFSGEKTRGERLLEVLLADIDRDTRERHRDGRWTRIAKARAFAMLGRDAEAVAALEMAFEDGTLPSKHWMHLQVDPSFDGLRGRQDFRQLQARSDAAVNVERGKLAELRRSGLIRPPGQPASGAQVPRP